MTGDAQSAPAAGPPQSAAQCARSNTNPNSICNARKEEGLDRRPAHGKKHNADTCMSAHLCPPLNQISDPLPACAAAVLAAGVALTVLNGRRSSTDTTRRTDRMTQEWRRQNTKEGSTVHTADKRGLVCTQSELPAPRKFRWPRATIGGLLGCDTNSGHSSGEATPASVACDCALPPLRSIQCRFEACAVPCCGGCNRLPTN
jgi:hypothetical protein